MALCGAGLLALSAGSGAARAADVIRGAQLYTVHCGGCHGPSGVPVMPDAPDFTRPDALLKPDTVLFQSIRSGRRGMPAYQGILKDQEILDVIAYLRTLRMPR